MEFILDLVKPDSLPSQVFCLLVLLIITLKDVKLSQNLKIGVLYIASFIMILFGWIEVWLGVLFLLLMSFLVLEIFTDDSKKKTLFGLIYKIIDCLYKLFAEYHLSLYLLSILVLWLGDNIVIPCQDGTLFSLFASWVCKDTGVFSAYIIMLSVLLLVISLICITRMRFETKSVTDLMDELCMASIYAVPIRAMQDKFHMLVSFEDKTFFNRAKASHTMLSPIIVQKAFKYVTVKTFLHPFKVARKIFSRGYGTIEMQLVRSVGIIRGYDRCKIRRKTFEIIYATLIFNSYRSWYMEYNGNADSYRYWILWCYIQKVPVRFSHRFFPSSDGTTAQQVFNKDFEELTLEEFFVWCLSLEFFAVIGPKTVSRREDIIIKYSLDRSKIRDTLSQVYDTT